MSNKIKLRIQKLADKPFQFDQINQKCFDKFQDQAKAGNYEVTYARKLPDKSQKQLGVVFGLIIGQTLIAFGNLGNDTSYIIKSNRPSGIEVSPELLKEYLYAVCPIFDEDGSRVTLSKMDVAQANKFIKDARNYISAEWSIFIPEPKKIKLKDGNRDRDVQKGA